MEHIPVLLSELVDSLNIKPDGIYVDMTLGGGGHAKKILERLKTGMLIGIDQDDFAIKYANEILKDFDNKIIIKNNYKYIKQILEDLNIKKVDGIYMDLGVSSFQLDDYSRGFSYNNNATIDMRMNKENEIDGKYVINNLSEDEIYNILKNYGEERFAKNIAKNIIQYRNKKQIETTFELVEIIKKSIPKKNIDKNPAKRTFQAIRIYVNDELNVLSNVLDTSVDLLNKNGRLSIITFHSLEDRIVKNKFREFENPCTCPKNYPCVCGKKSKGFIVNKKIVVPTNDEIIKNSRAKSAKLRVFEKT